MPRYRLTLEYAGTRYSGWQIQKNARTVQGELHKAIKDALGAAHFETYGAGRYLLDTVKGSDLGSERGRLILDFNFAYNPSCSYDPRWVCPLAPPGNRLPIAIRGGERYPL